MTGLLESNPNPKEEVVAKKVVKKNNKFKKITSVFVVSILLVSACKKGFEYCSKKSTLKQEEKIVSSLMKQQQDADLARKERVSNSKVAYLTFDDGPNYNTKKILEVLKENNIKATFFLVGSMIELNPSIVKDIKEQGHTIANHTYSHSYNYKDKESFLEEIEKTDDLISKALGEKHKSYFIRVPGGSMGKKIVQEAIKENGYKSVNWTGVFGDDEKGGKVNKEYIVNRVAETTGDDKYEVILAHGTKSVTVESLQTIIDNLKKEGYIFEPLMKDSPIDFY